MSNEAFIKRVRVAAGRERVIIVVLYTYAVLFYGPVSSVRACVYLPEGGGEEKNGKSGRSRFVCLVRTLK